MNHKNTEPAKLVTYVRDGLIEKEHFGYVVRYGKNHIIEKIGDDKNYPFYLRSCAKPLQAALIIDYELDKKYNLTEEEIALCAASHAGEKVHIDIVKNILNKFEISEERLKCGNHAPISRSAQDELLLHGEKSSAIHNNCSGKHAMMLGLCKLNDWDMDNYDNINHPLQQAILKKIYQLCEVKTREYPVTKDGCGVPVPSMPLENIVKGYLNLFCNPKYEKIKNAFLNHSYTIGGENRTDTKIIENSKGLIAKVGAGGLCVVVNTKLEEAFIVKICDADMSAREFVTIDLINNLHWANIQISHNIETNHHETVGTVITNL
ncbi:MAG: asparaginase [Candidatus Gastranaerophilaceae bacterium]